MLVISFYTYYIDGAFSKLLWRSRQKHLKQSANDASAAVKALMSSVKWKSQFTVWLRYEGKTKKKKKKTKGWTISLRYTTQFLIFKIMPHHLKMPGQQKLRSIINFILNHTFNSFIFKLFINLFAGDCTITSKRTRSFNQYC